jgi:hypothetical protein
MLPPSPGLLMILRAPKKMKMPAVKIRRTQVTMVTARRRRIGRWMGASDVLIA